MTPRIMKRRRRAKPVQPDGSFDIEALSAARKERLYRECEGIIIDAPGEPLSAAQRRLHARARRRGRPRKGRGTRVVALSIEAGLLRRAERLARARGISRSELFSRGLRAIIAIAG